MSNSSPSAVFRAITVITCCPVGRCWTSMPWSTFTVLVRLKKLPSRNFCRTQFRPMVAPQRTAFRRLVAICT